MFDAIILGLGGIGSATAAHLARRGVRVLGLEQFSFGHDRGSSHGQTRIIRTAYYEHPDYIPLVERSFKLWRELEQQCGRTLLLPSDCVTIGPADGELIAGLRLAKTRLPAGAVTTLDATQLRECYGFAVPGHFVGELEREAGILFVEECVRAHLEQARMHGATFHDNEPVLKWESDGNTVNIHTATATYTAKKLVITAGPWSTHLLGNLGVPLTVMRQVMTWFAPNVPMTRDAFPIFLLDSPEGAFYGLPAIDARGVKVARHYGAPELNSPDEVYRETTCKDETPVRQFLETYLPGKAGACTAMQPCIYTLTPDRHFVIDVHPHFDNVSIACGFSGHGFKFAAVVGEILADLAMTGVTRLPIEMFRANRFAGSSR
ncbi:N-methyl-L-tryptophan oxidase [soil metagenome]